VASLSSQRSVATLAGQPPALPLPSPTATAKATPPQTPPPFSLFPPVPIVLVAAGRLAGLCAVQRPDGRETYQQQARGMPRVRKQVVCWQRGQVIPPKAYWLYAED